MTRYLSPLLLVVLLGSPASAQTPTPAPDIEIVISCFAPADRICTTYRVNAVNRRTQPVEGILTIERPYPPATVRRALRLAPGASEEFFAYIEHNPDYPGTPPHQVLTTFKDSQGKEIARPRVIPIFQMETASRIVAISQPESRPPVVIARVPVVPLNPRDIPDRWWGLYGLSCLILNDLPMSSIGERQAAAIREWVAAGGILIVSPGADRTWLDHPLLKELLPVEIAEVEECSTLPALEARYGALEAKSPTLFYRNKGGKPAADFHASDPIRYGMGWTIFIPFDIGRNPFQRWKGLDGFLQRSLHEVDLRESPADYNDRGPYAIDLLPINWRHALRLQRALGISAADAASLPTIARYPTAVHIGLIFFGFCALILVNYLILKKRRMAALNIITIPIISLVVFFLVIGLGYAIKGLTVRHRVFTFVEQLEGGTHALETTTLTLNAPFATTIAASFGGDALPVSTTHPYSNDPRERDADRSVLNWTPERTVIDVVHPGQWADVNLRAISLRPFKGEIRLRETDGKIEIENKTPYAIRKAFHGTSATIGEGRCTDVPSIPAGGSVSVPINPRPIYSNDPGDLSLFLAGYRRYFGDGRQGFPAALFCFIDNYPADVRVDGVDVGAGSEAMIVVRGRE